MIVNYYCMYDNIAEDYGPLFGSKNDVTALRTYDSSFTKDSRIPMEDYDLYKIIAIDTETGRIITNDPPALPTLVVTGSARKAEIRRNGDGA